MEAAKRFDDYYRAHYEGRWEAIKAALLREKQYVAWANPYAKASGGTFSSHPHFPGIHLSSTGRFDEIEAGAGELRSHYPMDFASCLAPLALQVQEGEKVLDLCAAPGGKSLILASFLGESGELVCNDRSIDRRRRLDQVLKNYLPPSVLARVEIKGIDSTKWCLLPDERYKNFDKILLDAPCSSEKHVLESPSHLRDWSPGRSKNLARDQWAMLSSAWQALAPGGSLVYSTCSLCPQENDGVVEKLFERREDAELLVPFEGIPLPMAEKTRFGLQFLPDCEGVGPFYLSLAQKRP